jgi:GH24 family phage-related lysozyme (muramidase)
MHTSDKGRAFIALQEGFRSKAYQDAVGVWSIGFGHTTMAGQPHVIWGMTISRAQADAILARDLLKYEAEVLAEVMLEFDHAGGRVLPGLVNRRKAEAAMFQGHYPLMLGTKIANAVRTALVIASTNQPLES